MAMFYPKHRRPADVRRALDAADNSDSEVETCEVAWHVVHLLSVARA